MATKTFLKMPQEKRERILEAAWAEFETVSFAEASINRIIRRAGISRGSFYQYFTDKEDLFIYLMDEVQGKFVQWMIACLDVCGGDLFAAQQMTFCRVMDRRAGEDPIIERCVRVLRVNPGMDLRKMADEYQCGALMRQVTEGMDLTGFRSREPAFLRSVFNLTMMAMGTAVMEALLYPQRRGEYEEKLASLLDVIRWGSVQESCRSEQEGAKV